MAVQQFLEDDGVVHQLVVEALRKLPERIVGGGKEGVLPVAKELGHLQMQACERRD